MSSCSFVQFYGYLHFMMIYYDNLTRSRDKIYKTFECYVVNSYINKFFTKLQLFLTLNFMLFIFCQLHFVIRYVILFVYFLFNIFNFFSLQLFSVTCRV